MAPSLCLTPVQAERRDGDRHHDGPDHEALQAEHFHPAEQRYERHKRRHFVIAAEEAWPEHVIRESDHHERTPEELRESTPHVTGDDHEHTDGHPDEERADAGNK
jgi:hypothetical protein